MAMVMTLFVDDTRTDSSTEDAWLQEGLEDMFLRYFMHNDA